MILLSWMETLLEEVERNANEVRSQELRKVIEEYAKELREFLAAFRRRLN